MISKNEADQNFATDKYDQESLHNLRAIKAEPVTLELQYLAELLVGCNQISVFVEECLSYDALIEQLLTAHLERS